jgi:hypothetical protein
MTEHFETLEPVLGLAHGGTIGGEPAFTFPAVLDALALCTQHNISVLGVELMRMAPHGYCTEGISTYEVQLEGQSWHEFVLLNNSLAAEFVKHNRGGDDHFYLLTATLEAEFHNLRPS